MIFNGCRMKKVAYLAYTTVVTYRIENIGGRNKLFGKKMFEHSVSKPCVKG